MAQRPGPSTRMEEEEEEEEEVVARDDSMSIGSSEGDFSYPELFQRIHNNWQNEKLTSELGYPMVEEINCLLGEVKVMERNVKKLDSKDPRRVLHVHEVARIKFVLASYLRTRLAKIQDHCWFLLAEEEKLDPRGLSKLSPEELKFLKSYVQLVESHLKSEGLDKMPTTLQALDRKKMESKPNLDIYVFAHVNRDIGNIEVEDAEGNLKDIDLRAGSIHTLRYRYVSQFVHSGAVNLI